MSSLLQKFRQEKEEDTEENVVLRLIKEEVHKLEYFYNRDCRLNEVRNISRVPESVKVLTAREKAEKESISLDLNNVRAKKYAREDKENAAHIRGLIAELSSVDERIKSKTNDLKEISKFTGEVMKELAKLQIAAQKRRIFQSENIEKLKKRIEAKDNSFYYEQCKINQFVHDSKIRRNVKLRSILSDRELDHKHITSRLVESKRYRELDSTILQSCQTWFAIYQMARNETEKLIDSHREQNLTFLMTMNDLDRVFTESSYHQDLYDIKLRSRTDDTTRQSRAEKLLQQEMEEAQQNITELNAGLRSLRKFCPTPKVDESFICHMYEDLDEMNFSSVKRICEIEQLETNVTRKIQELAVEIDDFTKVKKEGEGEYDGNLLKIQAYTEHLNEEFEEKQLKLQLEQDSTSAIEGIIMGVFHRLSTSDALKEFLGTENRMSQANVAIIFHIMEKRIGELNYTKSFLTIRKEVEIYQTSPSKIGPQFYGHESSGGIINPEIFISPAQISIGEEVDELINVLGKIEPIGLQEAQKTARDEINKMKARLKNESDEKNARLSQFNRQSEEEQKAKTRKDLIKKMLDSKHTELKEARSVSLKENEDQEADEGEEQKRQDE